MIADLGYPVNDTHAAGPGPHTIPAQKTRVGGQPGTPRIRIVRIELTGRCDDANLFNVQEGFQARSRRVDGAAGGAGRRVPPRIAPPEGADLPRGLRQAGACAEGVVARVHRSPEERAHPGEASRATRGGAGGGVTSDRGRTPQAACWSRMTTSRSASSA